MFATGFHFDVGLGIPGHDQLFSLFARRALFHLLLSHVDLLISFDFFRSR
jgi:hypothetical protein